MCSLIVPGCERSKSGLRRNLLAWHMAIRSMSLRKSRGKSLFSDGRKKNMEAPYRMRNNNEDVNDGMPKLSCTLVPVSVMVMIPPTRIGKIREMVFSRENQATFKCPLLYALRGTRKGKPVKYSSRIVFDADPDDSVIPANDSEKHCRVSTIRK